MSRFLGGIVALLVGAALILAGVLLLLAISLRVSAIANPLVEAAAVLAELFLGVMVLLGTVYVSISVIVRIFRRDSPL